MFSFYEFFLPLFEAISAIDLAPISLPFALSSRLISSANFDTPTDHSALLDTILCTFNMAGCRGQILVTTPYSYHATSASDVPVTPAWRSTIWHVILAGIWDYKSTAEQQDAIHSTCAVSNAADKFRVITPGSGAYQNEPDVTEPNHEVLFWGSNYSRLVSIKKKYDPNRLLDCWQCLNWKGSSNRSYRCYTAAESTKQGGTWPQVSPDVKSPGATRHMEL